jgi:hypothetical protein
MIHSGRLRETVRVIQVRITVERKRKTRDALMECLNVASKTKEEIDVDDLARPL